MTQKLFAYTSPVPKSEDGKLFSGIWIRWRALSVAERLICTTIALIPVWWFLGITQFIPILLLLGIVLYDWWHKGEIRLKRPTALVIALFAFLLMITLTGF